MANSLKLKLQQSTRLFVKWAQKFTDKSWYTLLLSLFAALDNFIILVPTDGILISSTLLRARRWFIYACAISIGSALGALVLIYLLRDFGVPWLLEFYPSMNEGVIWATTEEFFLKYGLIVVFLVAVTPLMQHPALILACMSELPVLSIFSVVFVGRFIKYLIMSYICSYAPKLLGKLWGLQDELGDVGIDIAQIRHKN